MLNAIVRRNITDLRVILDIIHKPSYLSNLVYHDLLSHLINKGYCFEQNGEINEQRFRVYLKLTFKIHKSLIHILSNIFLFAR